LLTGLIVIVLRPTLPWLIASFTFGFEVTESGAVLYAEISLKDFLSFHSFSQAGLSIRPSLSYSNPRKLYAQILQSNSFGLVDYL